METTLRYHLKMKTTLSYHLNTVHASRTGPQRGSGAACRLLLVDFRPPVAYQAAAEKATTILARDARGVAAEDLSCRLAVYALRNERCVVQRKVRVSFHERLVGVGVK